MSDLFLTCRTKHIPGSPRHKGLKKTHFIKNMRQYDTKNSRYRPLWGCLPCPPSNLGGRAPALEPQPIHVPFQVYWFPSKLTELQVHGQPLPLPPQNPGDTDLVEVLNEGTLEQVTCWDASRIEGLVSSEKHGGSGGRWTKT